MQIFESGRYPYIYFFPFLFYIEEEIDPTRYSVG